MANSYPLDLVLTPQVVPLVGAPGPFHNIILSFDTAPSAGTVLIEYRNLGNPAWQPLSHANGVSITSGFFQVRLDGTVAALRVTFTGLVGGVGARVWDDFRSVPDGLYTGLAAVTTQPYTEANVKNGLQYDLRASWPLAAVIPTGQTRKIRFQTGAKYVLVKMRELQYIAEELTLRLFRAPTGVTGGTALSINNYNARNPVASTVTATKNVTTTTDGTEFNAADPEVFFGSSNNPQRNQATALQGRERILLPNTSYLVTITNTGGGDARAEYHLDWYEGDTDLPL
ncbi:hypothetical protein D3C85_508340 [compost metagenome]